ncbi:transmembrane protein, putative [Medicago truncatula]|uniref:Transmembrane protein, putative n=1 Tax=Medicago truncatula TaxID=3880 RepID=G7JQR3_MEDTR|nr:transmembrane protein, putative [Medicago truncatula]
MDRKSKLLPNCPWVGNTMLRVSFPRLFSVSNQKETKVGELWEKRGFGLWFGEETYFFGKEWMGGKAVKEMVFRFVWRSPAPPKVLQFRFVFFSCMGYRNLGSYVPCLFIFAPLWYALYDIEGINIWTRCRSRTGYIRTTYIILMIAATKKEP